MRQLLAAMTTVMTLAASHGALADEQTVTLTVDNMSCVTCPYMVQRTLADVDGVSDVDVSFEDKTAVVIFDDNKTDVAALTAATTAIGFPSQLVEVATP